MARTLPENDAEIAALQQRMAGVENDIHDIKQSIASGRTETLSALAAIQSKLESRAAPQWQALGVVLTFCTVVGALAYWPIREGMSDTRSLLKEVQQGSVDRDRRLWDNFMESRSRLDKLDGEWRAMIRRP